MALSQEQPPITTDEDLRNYLIRLRTDIDSELKKAAKFPERKEAPYKPQVGDVHYFGDPVDHSYDAEITSEGFWGLTSTGWEKLNTPGASAQFEWKYSTTTTAADPGSGNFRLNNTTIASATALYISENSKAGGDISALLNALAAGDKIYIQRETDSSEALLLDVTSVTDNTTWFNIAFTVDDSSGPTWTNNRDFGFILSFV